MIAVESGTFQMGASPKMLNSYWKAEASPRHQVTLTHDYMIGETEVTVALWRAVMNQTPTSMATFDDQEAVRDVTWLECQQFLYKLGKLTGIDFRLPTEAEWEFAARGGRKSKNYEFSGSNDPYEVSASLRNSNLKKWVKQFKPNELGIYDMTGGVAEWVEDYYGPYPTAPQTNPRGVKVGSEHVVRGGTQFSSGILNGC